MTEYQIITKEGQCTTVKADDFEIDKDKHTITFYTYPVTGSLVQKRFEVCFLLDNVLLVKNGGGEE